MSTSTRPRCGSCGVLLRDDEHEDGECQFCLMERVDPTPEDEYPELGLHGDLP